MAYTNINKGSSYFNTVLYTGNGSTNAITGVNFQPDLVWLKSRDIIANHQLYDVIRGATKKINSSTTNAEGTETNGLQSFDSDGFTLGLEYDVNNNTSTFTSWNWLANGAGSSNTDGSITSTVSASTTSGFSIVKYTGTGSNATVGHGLGSAPKYIHVKRLDTTANNIVYHSSVGATKYLLLDGTDTPYTNVVVWNDTSPTTSYFTVGTSTAVNASGGTYVAYCFAEKKGFSKFGNYTGSGSNLFVYTGFKPAFLICKRTDVADNWKIVDNKRSPYNVVDDTLGADNSFAEASPEGGIYIDLLSNGFAFKGMSNAAYNASGGTYIYMAFAEFPIVSSTGTPVTAR